MARPRLAVPFEEVLEAYQQTGSVRGAAELLTISRWAVERRLEEYGIPVLDRDSALAQVRLLRASAAGPRRVEQRTKQLGSGVIGCTVVTICRSVAYSPCVWPDCEAEAELGAVCAEHGAIVGGDVGCSCAWPRCSQDVLSTACCYEHDKIARGLIDSKPA